MSLEWTRLATVTDVRTLHQRVGEGQFPTGTLNKDCKCSRLVGLYNREKGRGKCLREL
jgi:hypothetical protein